MDSNVNPNQMPVEGDIPSPQGTSLQTDPVPVAAPSQPPQLPVGQSAVVTPSGRRGFPKKILFAVLAILVAVVLVFAVIRFVLPNIGSIGGPTEIVWWGLWEDENLVQPLIDEYQAANPGITITYRKSDKEDYRERLMSSLARGDGPDVFRLHNSWIPMFRAELAAAPADILSSQEFQSTFYPVATENLVGQEGPLAVPLEYDGLAMFVNEEIFITHGASFPTNWNQLREVAKTLTIKDERGVIVQSGTSLGTTANVDHWPEIVALLMLQNGANPNAPNDAAGRGEQALSFYKQFSITDGVWDDTLPSSTVAFAAGRVGMYFGPSWRALEIMERNPAFRFRVLPVPQVPKADPNQPDMTYASYWAEGVWSKSKNPGEAWKFLKFLSSRDAMAKFYENASRVRAFGEPYSRTDMRELLLGDPILAGFVSLAPNAKSSFLHSRTFDGASGINTSLSDYYNDALNAITPNRGAEREMQTLATGVQQVLARYGLAAPIPAPTR